MPVCYSKIFTILFNRLRELNVNNCKIPCVEFENYTETKPFQELNCLYINNNPLDKQRSVCQLSKLPRLTTLALGFQLKAEDYFPEFTFAIIRTLTMLNRTSASRREKRDFDIFYINSHSKDYYLAGGTVDPSDANLSADFLEKHPTYLQLVKGTL